MNTFTVITGFGYFTEISSGHIISKAILAPGLYPMSEGYEYAEVEDSAALDAIAVYQAPPPPKAIVGNVNFLPVIGFSKISQETGNMEEFQVHQNTENGFIVLTGSVGVAIAEASPKSEFFASITIDSDSEFGSQNERVLFEFMGGNIPSGQDFQDKRYFSVLIPAGFYYRFKLFADGFAANETTVDISGFGMKIVAL